jgi:hypothetical protein
MQSFAGAETTRQFSSILNDTWPKDMPPAEISSIAIAGGCSPSRPSGQAPDLVGFCDSVHWAGRLASPAQLVPKKAARIDAAGSTR